ncbi:MAG: glycine zipper 2TM domain-containing protein [Pseudomonadota bacterium]
MKSYLTISLLIISLFFSLSTSYAKPHHRHGFNDQARVIKVNPIYETVEIHRPVQKCWDEEIVYHSTQQQHNNYGGLVAGGIIGGIAGHQVGGGHGKDVATVAGTLLGAIIGNNITTHHRPQYRPVKKHIRYETHCDTIDNITSREEIVAYRVKYRYKGHTYWTRTKHHPGKYIDVSVNVKPL